MINKINHQLVLGAFLFIVITWGVLMYWWLRPYKTIEIKSAVPLQAEVKQGTDLEYLLDYCKHTDVIPSVTRKFIDGIIYAVPSSGVGLKEGCGKVVLSIPIPKSLPTGVYHLETNLNYQINPIRVINIEYSTDKFTVVK